MKNEIGIFISGANGRMGQNLIKMTMDDPALRLAGATESPTSPLQGADAGLNAGTQNASVTITPDFDRPLQKWKSPAVIIDFSSPAVTLNNVERAVEYKVPVVIGTTGFTEQEEAKLKEAAQKIPMVCAPNMSVGMNLVFKLVEEAARVMSEDYDIEILEAHHKYKKDSPSGTARRIAELVCEASGRNYPDDMVYQRHGNNDVRTKKEVGMQTIRGGDIVGEHTVYFCGEGERVEIKHVAGRRTTFAKGALRAAKWVVNQKAGWYTMRDVLGLNDA